MATYACVHNSLAAQFMGTPSTSNCLVQKADSDCGSSSGIGGMKTQDVSDECESSSSSHVPTPQPPEPPKKTFTTPKPVSTRNNYYYPHSDGQLPIHSTPMTTYSSPSAISVRADMSQPPPLLYSATRPAHQAMASSPSMGIYSYQDSLPPLMQPMLQNPNQTPGICVQPTSPMMSVPPPGSQLIGAPDMMQGHPSLYSVPPPPNGTHLHANSAVNWANASFSQPGIFLHVLGDESIELTKPNSSMPYEYKGPITVKLAGDPNMGPQLPFPLHVPVGHQVHQFVDEEGYIRHIVLSVDPVNISTQYPREMNVPQLVGPNMAGKMTTYPGAIVQQQPINGQQMQSGDQTYLQTHMSGTVPPHMAKGNAHLSSSSHHHQHQHNMQNHNGYHMNRKWIPKLAMTEEGPLIDPDHDENLRIREILCRMIAPKIINVLTTDVDISWSPIDNSEAGMSGEAFPHIDPSELVYVAAIYEITGRHVASYTLDPNDTLDIKQPVSTILPKETNKVRISNLRPNTDYSIQIKAGIEDRILYGETTEHVFFRTAPGSPEAPLNPRVVSKGTDFVSLSWGEPANNGATVSLYYIYHYEKKLLVNGEIDDDKQVPESIKGTNATISGLKPGTTYRIKIAAVNAIGPSFEKALMEVTTKHDVPPPKPSAPLITGSTHRTIRLAWASAASDCTYSIEIYDFQKKTTSILFEGMTETSAQVQDLSPSSDYRVRVLVRNDGGVSASDWVKARTAPVKPQNAWYQNGREGSSNQHRGFSNQQNAPLPNQSNQRSFGHHGQQQQPAMQAPKPLMSSQNYAQKAKPNTGNAYPQPPPLMAQSIPPPPTIVNAHHSAARTQAPEPQAQTNNHTPNGRVYNNNTQNKNRNQNSNSNRSSSNQQSSSCSSTCSSNTIKAEDTPSSSKNANSLRVKDVNYNVEEVVPEKTNKTCRGTNTYYMVKDDEVQCVNLQFSTREDKNKSKAPEQQPEVPNLKQQRLAQKPAKMAPPGLELISRGKIRVFWALIANRINPENLVCYELQRLDLEAEPIFTKEGAEFLIEGISEETEVIIRIRAFVKGEDWREDGEWSENATIKTPRYPPSNPKNIKYYPEKNEVRWECSDKSRDLYYRVEEQTRDGSIRDTIQKPVWKVPKLGPGEVCKIIVSAVHGGGVCQNAVSVKISVPATVPTKPIDLNIYSKSTQELVLTWSAGLSNGSPITNYRLKLKKGSLTVDEAKVAGKKEENKYVFSELEPNTSYKVEVCAENAIGTGPVDTIYGKTRPPPPLPPKLTCDPEAYSLKLRWTNENSDDLDIRNRIVRLDENNKQHFVWEGERLTYRVIHLLQDTVYTFQINASDEIAGTSEWSEPVSFRTKRALPPMIKIAATATKSLTTPGFHTVKWSNVLNSNPDETLFYRLQIRDVDTPKSSWQTVYEGREPTFSLKTPDYRVQLRVFSIRRDDGQDVMSAESPITILSDEVDENELKKKNGTVAAKEATSSRWCDFSSLPICATLLFVGVIVIMAIIIDWVFNIHHSTMSSPPIPAPEPTPTPTLMPSTMIHQNPAHRDL